ncbi:MAG: hypothetical protein PHW14_06255, partial [Candidatus Omnitrophica bacterium]|nr:hypothetical protein [Candidatus Omnitrophota bacterium]
KRTFLQFLGKVDDLGDAVTGPFNSNGNLGKMKGKVQSLTMRQSTDSYNRDGSVKETKTVTSTMAFFLDYVTPEFAGFTGGLQYVYVTKLYDGHHSVPFNDAYYAFNEKYHVLNEFYVNYNAKALGMGKTNLRAGRQIINYDFFKKAALRHKEAAAEGVVFSTKDIKDTELSVGHIWKYSSFASRDYPPYPTQFMNIGDVMRVPYRTAGATFASASYSGISNFKLTTYDWILYNLFNVQGNKIEYFMGEGDFKVVPRVHFAWERDAGRMAKDGLGKIESYALETAVALKYKRSYLEWGWLSIADNKRDGKVHNFQHPFDSSFTSDCEKGGDFTRQFNAGAQTTHLRAFLEWDCFSFVTTYYYTIHQKAAVNGATDRGTRDQQIEADLGVQITRNMSAKATFIYGQLGTNMTDRKYLEKKDARIWITYAF